VAKNNHISLSTKTNELEPYRHENILNEYPLSHIILALGFHLERLKDTVIKFESEYEIRANNQLNKSINFENQFGRKPVGIQQFTTKLIGNFCKYQKEEGSFNEIRCLISSSVTTDEFKAVKFQDTDAMLNILTSIFESFEASMLDRIGFSEKYLQKTFLNSLNCCYTSMMSAFGIVCGEYQSISGSNLAVYYPKSHSWNLLMSADHQICLMQLDLMRGVISKHLLVQMRANLSTFLELLASKLELASGPSIEIATHNLRASVESCWSRQIEEFLPLLDISNGVQKFSKLVDEVHISESDRRVFFSLPFHRLLQENKLIQ
jgi:hypothetical protein